MADELNSPLQNSEPEKAEAPDIVDLITKQNPGAF